MDHIPTAIKPNDFKVGAKSTTRHMMEEISYESLIYSRKPKSWQSK